MIDPVTIGAVLGILGTLGVVGYAGKKIIGSAKNKTRVAKATVANTIFAPFSKIQRTIWSVESMFSFSLRRTDLHKLLKKIKKKIFGVGIVSSQIKNSKKTLYSLATNINSLPKSSELKGGEAAKAWKKCLELSDEFVEELSLLLMRMLWVEANYQVEVDDYLKNIEHFFELESKHYNSYVKELGKRKNKNIKTMIVNASRSKDDFDKIKTFNLNSSYEAVLRDNEQQQENLKKIRKSVSSYLKSVEVYVNQQAFADKLIQPVINSILANLGTSKNIEDKHKLIEDSLKEKEEMLKKLKDDLKNADENSKKELQKKINTVNKEIETAKGELKEGVHSAYSNAKSKIEAVKNSFHNVFRAHIDMNKSWKTLESVVAENNVLEQSIIKRYNLWHEITTTHGSFNGYYEKLVHDSGNFGNYFGNSLNEIFNGLLTMSHSIKDYEKSVGNFFFKGVKHSRKHSKHLSEFEKLNEELYKHFKKEQSEVDKTEKVEKLSEEQAQPDPQTSTSEKSEENPQQKTSQPNEEAKQQEPEIQKHFQEWMSFTGKILERLEKNVKTLEKAKLNETTRTLAVKEYDDLYRLFEMSEKNYSENWTEEQKNAYKNKLNEIRILFQKYYDKLKS